MIEQHKHTMEFLNPIYHAGLNVTVRLGMKWAEKCRAGDTLLLKKRGEDATIALAEVYDVTLYHTIDDISPALLQSEHDPACRTVDGLHIAMMRAYGNNISGNPGPVSVVVFLV